MGQTWLGVWLVGADGQATNTNRCQAQLHAPPQLHGNAMDSWMSPNLMTAGKNNTRKSSTFNLDKKSVKLIFVGKNQMRTHQQLFSAPVWASAGVNNQLCG